MRSWLRSSRPRLLTIGALLLIVALIWPTQWLLGKTKEDDGAGIANVLALPVSALSLLAGIGSLLIALWPRARVDDPAVLAAQARTLLGLVAADEARALAQLLGDTGNPRPADVGFAQPEAATLRWRTDGGAQDGSLTTIAAYYQTLDLGRLVVLGEAGAGKTVLVLRLLLDLAAEARSALDADPQARVQVPVRLSLPSFATPDTPVAAASLRGQLEEWIADHLTDVHRVQKPVAVALVRDGWILPVLDGLDEMDPDQGVPRRAQQVITALNQPAGVAPGPVVLTCRTQHYQDLDALQDATAVLVQPLGSEQVIAWLAHRFPDPTQPDRLQRRWQRVATIVRRHRSGRLATCLTSPLRLYLAATIYAAPGTTPAELCDMDADELEKHLFARLIPAIVAHHPGPDHVSYTDAEVRTWIRTLADHLADMAAAGRSGADLYLHQLWRADSEPPHRRIQRQVGGLVGGIIAIPLIGHGIYYGWQAGSFVPTSFLEWFGVAACVIGCLGALVLIGLVDTDSPPRLDLRAVRTRKGRRRLVRPLLVCSVLGVIAGLVFALSSGMVAGLRLGIGPEIELGFDYAIYYGFEFGLGGLAVGLVVGLAFGLTVIPNASDVAAAHPSSLTRECLTWTIFTALAVGSSIGLASGFATGMPIGVATGSAVGLAAGLVPSPLPRYVLSVRRLHRAGRLPRRPGQFLDWAHRAGLIRMAGNAVQFRHRDLQAQLASSSGAPQSAPISP